MKWLQKCRHRQSGAERGGVAVSSDPPTPDPDRPTVAAPRADGCALWPRARVNPDPDPRPRRAPTPDRHGCHPHRRRAPPVDPDPPPPRRADPDHGRADHGRRRARVPPPAPTTPRPRADPPPTVGPWRRAPTGAESGGYRAVT